MYAEYKVSLNTILGRAILGSLSTTERRNAIETRDIIENEMEYTDQSPSEKEETRELYFKKKKSSCNRSEYHLDAKI